MPDFLAELRSGKIVLMDGAMGTELLRGRDISTGCCEAFNLNDPAAVSAVHRAYLDAGARVLLTNTFQAHPAALARHGLADRQHRIWQSAIALAHAHPQKPHFVLADIGPIEKLTADVASGLWDECTGVDGVLLETWSDLLALKVIADSPRRTDVPLLVSFTFRRDSTGKFGTVDDVKPDACARAAQASGAVAVGANCGRDIDLAAMIEIAARYKDGCNLPIFLRPNAGTPARTGDDWAYPLTPERMADWAPVLIQHGIAMVGGCCGIGPEHIRRLGLALR